MRDNRGKNHSLALLSTGLVAALCCGRDGNLSRLHRFSGPAPMVNYFESLLKATQLTDHKPISRAQLPILLATMNGVRFAQLLSEGFGFLLDEDQKNGLPLTARNCEEVS